MTICTKDRENLFGEIVEGEMKLNDVGEIVKAAWEWIGTQYPNVELDEWVVMPNHLHGVLVIHEDCSVSEDCDRQDDCRGGSRTAPTTHVSSVNKIRKPLGRLVGAFKTVSTKHVNRLRNTPGALLWQRNYYEHVIRNEADLVRIRNYISENPVAWEEDEELRTKLLAL